VPAVIYQSIYILEHNMTYYGIIQGKESSLVLSPSFQHAQRYAGRVEILVLSFHQAQ